MLRLMDKPQETPGCRRAIIARKPSRLARQQKKRAIKDRLHGSARDFGKLAAAAELGKQQTRLRG
jgi:hypothetical protein